MKRRAKITKFFESCLAAMLFLFVSVCFVGCNKNKYSETEFDNYTMYKNVSYGTHERNILDMCLPKNKTEAGLILFIHGGGWVAGDKSGYENEIVKWCNQYGYATCAINYRYASENNHCEDILNDITMALVKVKEIATQNDVAVGKMMLTGGSAGAHLSLQYAYAKKDFAPITPACVVSFAGPTDLTDENFFANQEIVRSIETMVSKIAGYSITHENFMQYQSILLQYSPISYVDSQTVPTVICHGVKDSVVPYSNATTLDAALTAAGVEHTLITFPNSNHGLESDPDCTGQANELMLQYAHEYLA